MRLILVLFTIIISLFGSLALGTEDAESELPWWAVTPEEVMAAPCKSQRPPTPSEMIAKIENVPGKKQNLELRGIPFKKQSSQLLKYFDDLHTYDLSLRDIQTPLYFKSKCTTVLCAVGDIYGSDLGLRLLYMQITFGMNGSHIRTKNASSWEIKEIDEVLQALNDYPPSLYPVAYNKRLVHFTRGRFYRGGERTIANASIELFDNWNNLSFPERQQTLLHEIGHTLAYKKNLDRSPDWLKIGGWEEFVNETNGYKYKDYRLIDPTRSVSAYGQTNPSEDFAESVVAYRFKGDWLKKNHPQKYQFLKKEAFAGFEYLHNQVCPTSY